MRFTVTAACIVPLSLTACGQPAVPPTSSPVAEVSIPAPAVPPPPPPESLLPETKPRVRVSYEDPSDNEERVISQCIIECSQLLVREWYLTSLSTAAACTGPKEEKLLCEERAFMKTPKRAERARLVDCALNCGYEEPVRREERQPGGLRLKGR